MKMIAHSTYQSAKRYQSINQSMINQRGGRHIHVNFCDFQSAADIVGHPSRPGVVSADVDEPKYASAGHAAPYHEPIARLKYVHGKPRPRKDHRVQRKQRHAAFGFGFGFFFFFFRKKQF